MDGRKARRREAHAGREKDARRCRASFSYGQLSPDRFCEPLQPFLDARQPFRLPFVVGGLQQAEAPRQPEPLIHIEGGDHLTRYDVPAALWASWAMMEA